MSASEPQILVQSAGPVGIIELARPQVFNCLSSRCFTEILAALRAFEQDRGTRVLLIRSQGKHFCTGAELGEVKSLRADTVALSRFIALGHEVLRALEASRLPVVGAVHGLCLAGGLELMLACDVVMAGEGARFGDQHGHFGLLPGWGGTQRLPRIVGLRRAMDLFLTVRWIEADRAEQWGLVNRVVEDAALHDEALALCHAMAARSGPGLAMMKRLAREGLDVTLEAGLRLEQAHVIPALGSEDVSEGLAAFEERRTPDFPSAK